MLITSSMMTQKQTGGENLCLLNIERLAMVIIMRLNYKMGDGAGAPSERG